MSILNKYTVQQIPAWHTYSWLLKKHYAHRIPSIKYAFGLYDVNSLIGICTFGITPNYVEMKAWEPFNLLELNRLVINDDSLDNSASYFIGQCFKLLPKPVVLISYADMGHNHQGFIYQATNWKFTGVGGEGCKIYVLKNGYEQHQRHGEDIKENEIDHIEYTTGKNRYYYFLGNKKDKHKMEEMLRFPILPYPKGNNKRYDASYEPPVQGLLI